MTRLMGDATHANVAQLAAVPGLQLAAGYVTGTPDIRWTGTDWMQFPGLPLVSIDQGANGSPVPDAVVRDVETGAWSPASAVIVQPWNAARRTIYCNRNTLPAVLAAGWQGDLWLAIPGWQPGQPLPQTPGCTVVAVQNDFNHPDYDLSIALDDTWPLEDPVTITIPGINAEWPVMPALTIDTITGVMYYTGIGMDGHVWQARGVTTNGVVAWTIAPL